MPMCIVLSVLAGLIYPAIYLGYRQVLAQKRLEIKNVVTPRIEQRYQSVFGIKTDVLFHKSYSWYSYVCALAPNFAVGFVIVFFAFELCGLKCSGSPELDGVISKLPQAVLAALAGAYLWGLNDAIHRYQSVNLTPESLHFMWLRAAIAAAIAPFVARTFQGGLGSLVAFGLGAFPLSTLSSFLTTQASKKLNIKADATPHEAPTLQNLQGMNSSTLDALSEIGIGSTEHLAYADPLKLFLRTNLPWKVILDQIDAAVLFNYIGTNAATLRPIGIRGALELSDVGWLLNDKQTEQEATVLVAKIAEALGNSVESVKNLLRTVAEDYQVQFIGALWGSAYSDVGDAEQHEEKAAPRSPLTPIRDES